MTGREIGFEWALEGKRPGAHHDYELLSWSDDRLGPEVFEEIRSRYAMGLSADLPQVTIAVAATRERERVSRHIVLAVQKWSGHRDATNRKIVHTHWFYVPYQELAAHQVSYEALYHALANLPVTPSPPLTVRVPELDPTALGPGPDARCAAALLLTGRPVCVVGADRVPMIERLRFLDTVAALLPYGMRSRLTAATWTSSTARHKIRLSFARHAPENAHEVRWGHGAEITRRDSLANVCLDLLTRPDVRLPDMLRRLAGLTDPLSFGPEDVPVAVRLLEHAGYPELLPPAATGASRGPEHVDSKAPRTGSSSADTVVAAGRRKALPGPAASGPENRGPVPGGGGGVPGRGGGVPGGGVPGGGGTPGRGGGVPGGGVPGGGVPGGGVPGGGGIPGGAGGVPGPEIVPPAPGPVERWLTSPVRRLRKRLRPGAGEGPAVPAPGVTPGAVPESRGTPAAATVPYRPTAAAGPSAVPPSMQTALGGLEPADRGRRFRPGWGLNGKATVVVACTALALTLIGTGVVAMLRAPGGGPPAEGDAAGMAPGTVVVQAPSGQEDAFAGNVVTEVVRQMGYRFELRLSEAPTVTAPVAEPAVVLVEIPPADPGLSGAQPAQPADPLAAQGYSTVAAIPVPNRDVLVYDAGLIGPDRLTAAFARPDDEIRISVPDAAEEGPAREGTEQILRQRHPWLRLKTVPALDPLRALRDKEVQAAVVPREAARDSGYQRSEALAGLPGRSLLILCNQADGHPLRDALATVARSVDPGRLVSEDFDSPVTAAARLVESALPPPSVPQAGDRGRGSIWPALSLIAAGGAAGFLALLLAVRLPARIEPHRHPPRPPSAPGA
ncbi:hypothetical protein OHA77_29735 [Streptosporangium sp. NBC_01639]|uniref:hypothetical protein n=1 Tax=Streptosporangium sp. NBC_01639 TaxID=2975948 RepID=UPI00386A77DD|nr:hypothetical protein OHA77_29735 [Streptosporangium sp. NBC_01639]